MTQIHNFIIGQYETPDTRIEEELNSLRQSHQGFLVQNLSVSRSHVGATITVIYSGFKM